MLRTALPVMSSMDKRKQKHSKEGHEPLCSLSCENVICPLAQNFAGDGGRGGLCQERIQGEKFCSRDWNESTALSYDCAGEWGRDIQPNNSSSLVVLLPFYRYFH